MAGAFGGVMTLVTGMVVLINKFLEAGYWVDILLLGFQNFFGFLFDALDATGGMIIAAFAAPFEIVASIIKNFSIMELLRGNITDGLGRALEDWKKTGMMGTVTGDFGKRNDDRDGKMFDAYNKYWLVGGNATPMSGPGAGIDPERWRKRFSDRQEDNANVSPLTADGPGGMDIGSGWTPFNKDPFAANFGLLPNPNGAVPQQSAKTEMVVTNKNENTIITKVELDSNVLAEAVNKVNNENKSRSFEGE
jgi:hypothetical protein